MANLNKEVSGVGKLLRLTPSTTGLDRKTFIKFLRYLFDDYSIVSEEYEDHSECLVQIVAEVGLSVAEDAVATFGLIDRDEPITANMLFGAYMVEGTRSYGSGFHWDCVDEAVMVEEVTETIIRTKWKPLHDQPEACCPQK